MSTQSDGFFVLEDNASTPSGISYGLENRETMPRMFPGRSFGPGSRVQFFDLGWRVISGSQRPAKISD
nr:circularly permuted type 2 ATP-grasp protein [Algimonas ampicilliniresistens]